MALVAGVCFGLGYGVVQRLMAVEFPQLVQLSQAFAVREFPGTGLEALRLRVGAEAQSIRGDLGVLELEKEEQEKTKEQAKEQESARTSAPPLEPAPPIRQLPAEQQRFSEPPAAPADPEPLPEVAPPELPEQSTP
jgi:hypothetical protein